MSGADNVPLVCALLAQIAACGNIAFQLAQVAEACMTVCAAAALVGIVCLFI